jgi:hypothetical protein
MRPNDELTQLAKFLAERKEAYASGSLILFLGRECADAAGAPDTLEIARQVLQDPDLKAMYGERDLTDDQHLLEAFTDFYGEMTEGQRYRMLQSFYDRIPVPTFYQDLAILIKAGFFRHILTTSIDTLLEQALMGAGLWPEKNYQVISLGQTDKQRPVNRSTPSEVDILIVKLHGDLAQRQVAITKEEIADALEPQRMFIKGELSGDLIVVGYEFESEPLNRWLSWVPGDVWWVSEKQPETDQIREIEQRRRVQYITGSVAHPENFFSQLVYLLWRSATAVEKGISEQDWQEPGDDDNVEEMEFLETEDFSDAEFLQSQLRRSQSLLMTLEQTTNPVQRNVSLQAQIDYQRKRVVELEDQLRSLDDNRKRVLSLLKQINLQVRSRVDDAHLVDYLRIQINTIVREYRRDLPNQAIISAAMGATWIFLQRLGEDLIDAELMDELSSYAPSALSRRM